MTQKFNNIPLGTKVQNPLPQLVERKTPFQLVITKELLDKIHYLCSKYYNREWSGKIFYTFEGNIQNPSKLILKAKDLFIMDLGSTGFTSFEHSPQFAGYITRNPDLMDCKQGLIHSHHSMDAFFSTTDENTLREFSNDNNNFLSLIVNNIGKYNAKLGVKSTIESVSNIKYTGLNGELKILEEGVTKHNEVILSYPATIIKEGIQEEFSDMITHVEAIDSSRKDIPKHNNKYTVYTDSYNDKHYTTKTAAQPVQKEIFETNSQQPVNKYVSLAEELILKAASLSYFRSRNKKLSFKADLMDALESIPKFTIKPILYSGLIIDNLEIILNSVLGLTLEEEQTNILEAAINILAKIELGNPYFEAAVDAILDLHAELSEEFEDSFEVTDLKDDYNGGSY